MCCIPESLDDDLFASADVDPWAPGVGVVDSWSSLDWSRSEGFHQAARIVAAAASTTKPTETDRLVAPAVFLYRHAIELKLKELIGASRQLLGSPSEAPLIHDLVVLWAKVQPALEHPATGRVEPYRGRCDAAIRQLQAIDTPSATSLRYPDPSLRERLQAIDIARVAIQLDGVLEVLEAWCVGIGEWMANHCDD